MPGRTRRRLAPLINQFSGVHRPKELMSRYGSQWFAAAGDNVFERDGWLVGVLRDRAPGGPAPDDFQGGRDVRRSIVGQLGGNPFFELLGDLIWSRNHGRHRSRLALVLGFGKPGSSRCGSLASRIELVAVLHEITGQKAAALSL